MGRLAIFLKMLAIVLCVIEFLPDESQCAHWTGRINSSFGRKVDMEGPGLSQNHLMNLVTV